LGQILHVWWCGENLYSFDYKFSMKTYLHESWDLRQNYVLVVYLQRCGGHIHCVGVCLMYRVGSTVNLGDGLSLYWHILFVCFKRLVPTFGVPFTTLLILVFYANQWLSYRSLTSGGSKTNSWNVMYIQYTSDIGQHIWDVALLTRGISSKYCHALIFSWLSSLNL
jgi:hypothetical protein